jgi:hypothetical protein
VWAEPGWNQEGRARPKGLPQTLGLWGSLSALSAILLLALRFPVVIGWPDWQPIEVIPADRAFGRSYSPSSGGGVGSDDLDDGHFHAGMRAISSAGPPREVLVDGVAFLVLLHYAGIDIRAAAYGGSVPQPMGYLADRLIDSGSSFLLVEGAGACSASPAAAKTVADQVRKSLAEKPLPAASLM